MSIMIIVKWLIAIVIAFFVGKLVSKLRLPSILGWLITGIVLGSYAFSLVARELMDAPPTARLSMYLNVRWDL